MSRFNAFLHRTGERLELPRATRSLILVEIASDLEDLFQHYLGEGLDEEEAAARAEEKVNMSDEALAELVRIHSEARGWTERLSRRAQPFWERIAMVLIVLVFFAAASLGSESSLFEHLNWIVWPIVLVLIAVVFSLIVQLVQLVDPPSLRRTRQRLTTPLFLGAASVVLGFLGSGIHMYRTLMAMVGDPQAAAPMFARAVLETTSALAVALLVAIVAGISWFVLAGRIARLENEAAQSLTEVN
jgi:hypothetical protein